MTKTIKKAAVLFSVAMLFCAIVVGAYSFATDVHATQSTTTRSKILVNHITQDMQTKHQKPTTNPSGVLLTALSNLDFSSNSYTWIENDDWDWDTLAQEYGNLTVNDKCYMGICPVGAGMQTKLEVWINNSVTDLTNACGVMAYVDFSAMLLPQQVKVGMELCTSASGTITDVAKLTRTSIANNTTCYYFDYASGNWQPSVAQDGLFAVPDAYIGYVYVPISAYGGKQAKYLQMYHFAMSVADNHEVASTVFVTDFAVVKEGSAHTHSYTASSTTVDATCTRGGATVCACSCGQVVWQNVTQPTGHTIGEKYHCAPNLSGSLCSVCNTIEYFNENSALHWQNAVSVTYNYNVDGVDSTTREYPNGYKLTTKDIPWVYKVQDQKFTRQFFRWTSDVDEIEGFNPVGVTLANNLTLYGGYNICSYDAEKFRSFVSDVSLNGGPYDTNRHAGKIVFVGNSNYSLWHTMESWYADKGLTVLNNSIGGASSYNYVEFWQELVLMYKPSLVITVPSSNDYTYHQMTDKAIMANQKAIVDATLQHLPNAKVVITSEIAMPGRPEYYDSVVRINQKCQALANDTNVFFVDMYDQAWQYLLQYPTGWEFWTHLDQAHLQPLLGTTLYDFLVDKQLVSAG